MLLKAPTFERTKPKLLSVGVKVLRHLGPRFPSTCIFSLCPIACLPKYLHPMSAAGASRQSSPNIQEHFPQSETHAPLFFIQQSPKCLRKALPVSLMCQGLRCHTPVCFHSRDCNRGRGWSEKQPEGKSHSLCHPQAPQTSPGTVPPEKGVNTHLAGTAFSLMHLDMHACVRVSMCACVYARVPICVCEYVHRVYMHLFACVPMCVCERVHVYASVCMCAHVYVSMCVCACICICLFACVPICVCEYVCVCMYMHLLHVCISVYVRPSVCLGACVCAGLCACVHIRVHLCVHVCARVCVYEHNMPSESHPRGRRVKVHRLCATQLFPTCAPQHSPFTQPLS